MEYLENRIPPPLVALFFGACMWVVAKITSTIDPGSVAKYSIVGLLCILGTIFSASGVISFRKARTTVNPFEPESATSLVTSGVYQITRNPMYLGFVMFLCAWTVYLGSFWSVGLIALFMFYIRRFQILPEEKALEGIFGQEFIDYKNKVRPWI